MSRSRCMAESRSYGKTHRVTRSGTAIIIKQKCLLNVDFGYPTFFCSSLLVTLPITVFKSIETPLISEMKFLTFSNVFSPAYLFQFCSSCLHTSPNCFCPVAKPSKNFSQKIINFICAFYLSSCRVVILFLTGFQFQLKDCSTLFQISAYFTKMGSFCLLFPNSLFVMRKKSYFLQTLSFRAT